MRLRGARTSDRSKKGGEGVKKDGLSSLGEGGGNRRREEEEDMGRMRRGGGEEGRRGG